MADCWHAFVPLHSIRPSSNTPHITHPRQQSVAFASSEILFNYFSYYVICYDFDGAESECAPQRKGIYIYIEVVIKILLKLRDANETKNNMYV